MYFLYFEYTDAKRLKVSAVNPHVTDITLPEPKSAVIYQTSRLPCGCSRFVMCLSRISEY